jgi:hypothetical protein
VDDNLKRPVALVVPGATHFDRQAVVKQYVTGEWRRFQSGIHIDADPSLSSDWLTVGVLKNFTNRIISMEMPPVNKNLMAGWYQTHVPQAWNLLWNLIAVDEFCVEDPLRGLVDKPFYLVHDVHRALWEARFLARENNTLQAAEGFVLHFTRWLVGDPLDAEGEKVLSALGINRHVVSPVERLDVLCFLLCLACQNGLLERAVFFFDDLEHALQPNRRSQLRQLWDLLECSRRWVRIGGCPLGVLIGFTGSRADMQLLTKLHPKLSVDITAGLNRTRRALSS